MGSGTQAVPPEATWEAESAEVLTLFFLQSNECDANLKGEKVYSNFVDKFKCKIPASFSSPRDSSEIC